MRAEDAVRIRHMMDAAELALDFTRGPTRSDLDRDKMLKFALVQAIQVIGEAANKVSPEGRQAGPAVPWQVITGMRNRLVHAYFDVDGDLLWATTQKDLPALLEQLRALDLSS